MSTTGTDLIAARKELCQPLACSVESPIQQVDRGTTEINKQISGIQGQTLQAGESRQILQAAHADLAKQAMDKFANRRCIQRPALVQAIQDREFAGSEMRKDAMG
ncbi:unnamed protein product, partial [Prorocentrum cordatum]